VRICTLTIDTNKTYRHLADEAIAPNRKAARSKHESASHLPIMLMGIIAHERIAYAHTEIHGHPRIIAYGRIAYVHTEIHDNQ
jgi:hypothetical protein